MIKILTVLVVAFFTGSTSVHATSFAFASYSLEYPNDWTNKVQITPDGGTLQMFTGPEKNGAMPYCHVLEQILNPILSPSAANFNDKQRIDYFINADQQLLFLLYNNLASAQKFRLIFMGPNVIGKATPAFTSDFIFYVPQGFFYRVRSHYTFWKSAQLSIWCQAVAAKEANAEDSFLTNLSNFQRFVASVKINPNNLK